MKDEKYELVEQDKELPKANIDPETMKIITEEALPQLIDGLVEACERVADKHFEELAKVYIKEIEGRTITSVTAINAFHEESMKIIEAIARTDDPRVLKLYNEALEMLVKKENDILRCNSKKNQKHFLPFFR